MNTSVALKKKVRQISAVDVTKLFGAHCALRGVSVDAYSGDIVGILGRNGAGKSTLLGILSSMMKPTLGRMEVNGSVAAHSMRSLFGVLSHKALVYPALSCRENLSLYASLYGLGDDATDRMRDMFELTEFFTDRPASVLSRGQLQRLSLARAMIASPEVLLLDEPTSGLDHHSLRMIESIVNAHREKGGITFIVSHDPRLISALCTRTVLLLQGEKIRESGVCAESQIASMLEGKTL